MSVSPQVKLVQDWEQAFQKKDLALVEKSLHKDYRHVTYPRSLNQKDQSKDEFLGRLRHIDPHCAEIESTTHSVIEAPGKVILHLTNKIKNTRGVDAPYEALVIATVVPDDDGTLKIKQIEEFADSKTYTDRIEGFGVPV